MPIQMHSTVTHPEWSRNATIYEVNVRQYTKEGTFNAFAQHLPRLKEMGVDILWLMPIHPIGEKNRKGTLGSAYSIQNYYEVNPDFGTLEDLQNLVHNIHELGMYVIIDWVANHTAWDHVWVTEHPEWYLKDDKGEIHSYTYDNGSYLEYWTDVLGLDYQNREVWNAMEEAMIYWVQEANIDGFRCDVAGLVPIDFWRNTRQSLEKIKPVFMLAEWSTPEMHEAFDMTYDWGLYETMVEVSKGTKNALDIKSYFDNPPTPYPEDSYRMLFTSNHDKNAWEAHDGETFGDKFKAFAVLAATLPGMPLLYSGQESYLDKRLSFFEKDYIQWKKFEFSSFYQGLFSLRKQNKVLWSGISGGKLEFLSACNKDVLVYSRRIGTEKITVAVNLSDIPQRFNNGDTSTTYELTAWSHQIING